MFQSELFVFSKDGRNNQICYRVFAGGQWTALRFITLRTDRDIPAAATDNEICVVAKEPTPGPVMHVRIDRDGNPGPVGQIADAVTNDTPGITEFGGNFYVFYRTGSGQIVTRHSGAYWRSHAITHYQTNDEICPVGFDNKIWLFFSKQVWIRIRRTRSRNFCIPTIRWNTRSEL